LATPIQPSRDVEVAIRGLEDIRTAALLIIISSILAVAGLAVSLSLILSAVFGSASLEQFVGAIVGGAAVFVILLLVSLILSLVAMFAKFIPGLGKLKQWRAEFSTAHTLVKIGMVGGLILVLLAFVVVIASAFAQSIGGVLGGFGLLFLGGILLLIGYIGIIVACFNLNSVFRESMYLVAGVLFLVSLLISFTVILAAVSGILSLIGWILIYAAVPRSIASLRSIQPTPAQPTQMV